MAVPSETEVAEPENSDISLTNLISEYNRVRKTSELLCEPLAIEDYGIQTMDDVSPPKWHLAHTSWFFETFLLKPFFAGYPEYNPQFAYLFNSYYEQVGQFYPRPKRGLLSRPTVNEVLKYRAYIDDFMRRLLAEPPTEHYQQIQQRVVIGINHEQQHQELLLTDIKHILGMNPLRPAYRDFNYPEKNAAPLNWVKFTGGLKSIGAAKEGFAFDNEQPLHDVWLQPFYIASRPVLNIEYINFINDGGYERSELWLSEGWKAIKDNRFAQPLYWEKKDGEWWHYTLGGLQPVNLQAPVCHVNYYEADAYATWCDKRLPTEQEWEMAAESAPVTGNLRSSGYMQPVASLEEHNGLYQLYGDVWEWTQSAYSPYPGYKAAEGALGEYNGKFMCSQYVLKGGSCVTPADHIRRSYRNFFYPADQWQFSGIRLAGDVS